MSLSRTEKQQHKSTSVQVQKLKCITRQIDAEALIAVAERSYLYHWKKRSRWGVDHVVFVTKVFTTKQSSDYAFLSKFKISLSKATKTTWVYIGTKTRTKRHQREINDKIKGVFSTRNKNRNRYARKRHRKAA